MKCQAQNPSRAAGLGSEKLENLAQLAPKQQGMHYISSPGELMFFNSCSMLQLNVVEVVVVVAAVVLVVEVELK